MIELEQLFKHISQNTPGGTPSAMFGAQSIKCSNGKNAAIFWKDEMMFKLSDNEISVALKEAGTIPSSHLYDLGKPMTGWVTIDTDHSSKWAKFATAACAYVSSL